MAIASINIQIGQAKGRYGGFDRHAATLDFGGRQMKLIQRIRTQRIVSLLDLCLHGKLGRNGLAQRGKEVFDSRQMLVGTRDVKRKKEYR